MNYILLRGCTVSLCVASYVGYSSSSSLYILCNNTSLGRVFNLLVMEVNVCASVLCMYVCVTVTFLCCQDDTSLRQFLIKMFLLLERE